MLSKLKANQTVPKTPVGVRKILPKPVITQVPPAILKPPLMIQPLPKKSPVLEPIVNPAQKEKGDATSTKLIELTNQYRTQNKLPPLTFNPILSKSAQKRAEKIAQDKALNKEGDPWNKEDSWVHNGWHDEIQNSGYQGALNQAGQIRSGENLGKDFKDVLETLRAWQKSPTHNANLINGNFRDVGIGWAQYKDKKGRTQTVFVQHFGVPKQ